MIERNPWQDPCEDVLELILRKVSYFDLPSFSAVCSSWYLAEKTYRPCSSRPILLSLAADGFVARDSNRLNLRFRTLPDGDATDAVVPLRLRYQRFYCIGWSKQLWLLADMKSRTQIVLIDRLFRQSFRLPLLVPRALDLHQSADFGIDIAKVVVLVMPEKESGDELMNNIVVVAIINGPRSCMVYYMDGSWAVLDRSTTYFDIVARETRLFAVDSADSVRVWEFNHSIVNCPMTPMTIMRLRSTMLPDRHMCPYTYVVKPMGEKNDSLGDIFVVQRFLINNARVNPRAMRDPNFVLYSTALFRVFKYRLELGASWVEVDSLGDDVALFLGRNESVSVSIRDLPKGYQGNSIYFTHDYNVNVTYRIHCGEIGVYSLEHKSIKFFGALDDHRNGPSPVWMV